MTTIKRYSILYWHNQVLSCSRIYQNCTNILIRNYAYMEDLKYVPAYYSFFFHFRFVQFYKYKLVHRLEILAEFNVQVASVI